MRGKMPVIWGQGQSGGLRQIGTTGKSRAAAHNGKGKARVKGQGMTR